MRVLAIVLLLLPASVLAQAPPIPDTGGSYCQVTPGAFVLTPAGSGASLVDQGMLVEVYLRSDGQPVPLYPHQDIWLDDAYSGDIALCPGGSMADADTDENGRTTISGPFFGGGWTQNGMAVLLAGHALPQTPWGVDVVLDLQANSPDINGDREVNIQDITLFANDLGAYAFRSDFNHDGRIDLSDMTLFSNWLGESCP